MKVIIINLIGTFNCVRLAASAMSQTEPLADGERGAIINTASVAAFDGQIGQAAYSASKGGLVGMTLPDRPRPRRHRRAGQYHRPRPDRHPDLRLRRGRRGVQGQVEARRGVPRPAGLADEFASLALELITNSYMNGETIRIDGAARLQPK